MENLIADLKLQIAEQLKLKRINAADIGDDEPLFGAGLGLDSLDVLELIVLLKNKYRLKVSGPEEGLQVFRSVRTMAEFITANTLKNA